jgi:dipeptidyl aminopeptidase/acylaminoacyl peptidase
MRNVSAQKTCGFWSSPISAEMVTLSSPNLYFLKEQNNNLYWVESRPWDNGRNVIMCHREDGTIYDLIPAPFSHLSKVHEYGGCAYAVHSNFLYFVNASDQRIYQINLCSGERPLPITNDDSWRYADLIINQNANQLIAVGEWHNDGKEPENHIVGIDLNGSNPTFSKTVVLVSGSDFFAYPRMNHNGDELCWIQWQHPNMPWDQSELMLANVTNGKVTNVRKIISNPNESLMQPHWAHNGDLYVISDRSDWWNIYQTEIINFGEKYSLQPLVKLDAEFCAPLWQLGATYFDFIDANTIACLFTHSGHWHLALLDTISKEIKEIKTEFDNLHSICVYNGRLACIASNSSCGPRILTIQIENISEDISELYIPSEGGEQAAAPTKHLASEDFSKPNSIWFESIDKALIHGFLYPPLNVKYRIPKDTLPPVIIMCHGGPTGATNTSLNLKIQFWTSRGFSVFDINYRGSSGFGRKYRQSLSGAWGIADVHDAQFAALHLIKSGLINSNQCIIRGSSAGGFTVLAALTFTDTFNAGACYYGISDLVALTRDTHKFESHYLDNLIGPYPLECEKYIKRSPINHVNLLDCPVVFFQGLQDKVVPPDQAQKMVKALGKKNIFYKHIEYNDEGHGFRKAANIIHSLETELSFYLQVFDQQTYT